MLFCRSWLRSSATSCRKPLMLTEKRRETLGSMYSLVGTHSAVKLCRWQKSMLRNRGGCYKWTMYGIQSHRCMEATPNLACANKCVFCWRLNSNPVATEWKWDVDHPKETVQAMLSSHRALVKDTRGVPGVTADRFDEAMRPQHCALSLVGEPILYPRINEFVAALHEEGISTFLVNNGQFPECIERLAPVTQLYLSVDAPNRETMKILDRPVFEDYWERFNRSVALMKTKRIRTVFRLTLIEGYNMGQKDVDEYKKLFQAGEPLLVELKQLTPAFYGRSTILRLHNVPTFERIVSVAKQLCDGTPYEIASVHEHSACVLLAQRSKSFVDGRWNTWINFPRWISLANEDPTREPSASEYATITPPWAVYGSPEAGFDPKQERFVSAKGKRWQDKQQGATVVNDIDATAAQ